MSDEELFRVAAGIAGQALDMQSQNALRAPLSKGAEVLAAAIDADRITLRGAFDAVDYFNGVAKRFVITAICEAVNEDEEGREAEKEGARRVRGHELAPTGWLPPELRCATYSGLGEAPKAIAAQPLYPDFDESEDEDLDEVA
ncbi:hypothetical protein [Allomesorhizobium alhagi]|jgi:ParB family chromosome partitioning protein|uniref:Uncharacterized protein n=1 Tax=Mesorhizobium alhagi CCNWXJ12-2 TaxID=1107882 RepID=H0I2N6_9HYPH|nr:hypothetical protein [Mesorhizobium alhagi]EHK52735.1 hypothetical protein MAXJ12_33709 [Mesorhizobium alhagi CCNWXJ12-2]